MGHKLNRSGASLLFPSGRVVYTDNIRRELARRLCGEGVEWVKRTERLPREHENPRETALNWNAVKYEASAVAWLVARGMVELHEKDSRYFRWSPLHERPRFGADREAHVIGGHRIPHLSPDQKMMITQALIATMQKRAHEVLVRGAVSLQRTLSKLESRGILVIEKRAGVWALRIAPKYLAPPVT